MTYRLYTQPMQLKTPSKPADGELLVDTEDGHIFVYDAASNKLSSATKDLNADMAIDTYLMNLIKQESAALTAQVDNLEATYSGMDEALTELKAIVVALQTRITNIRTQLTSQMTSVGTTTTTLLNLHETIGDLLEIAYTQFPLLTQLTRINKEFTYLLTLPGDVKTRLGSDITALKAYKSEVENLLATKVDKTEYDAWVASYVADMKALHPSAVTFTYIG